jgi:hypothetical protein
LLCTLPADFANFAEEQFMSDTLFEDLESRMLFSVTPTVQADLDAITADKNKITSDRAAMLVTLRDDRAAILTDRRMSTQGDPTLIQKLKDDKAAYLDKTRQDRANLLTTLQSDRATILADTLKIRADAGNIPAVAADRLTLESDRSNMISHFQTFLAIQVQDKAGLRQTLFDDLSAIAASKGSPNLAADRAKLSSDNALYTQVLIDDRTQLLADVVKLRTDIRAGV